MALTVATKLQVFFVMYIRLLPFHKLYSGWQIYGFALIWPSALYTEMPTVAASPNITFIHH